MCPTRDNMPTHVIHEPKALYAALEDKELLRRGPVFIERNGKPEAVLMSVDHYNALVQSQEYDRWRLEQLSRTQANHEAFLRLLPGLLQVHGGKWVAVCNEQVIGVGTSYAEACQRADRAGCRNFYSQKVQEIPRILDLPLEVVRS